MKTPYLDKYKSFYDERRSLTYGHDYENFRADGFAGDWVDENH